MRRALLIASVAMVTAGCVVLADAAITLAWKEPVSAVYAGLNQNAAESELAELREGFLALPEVEGLGPDEVRELRQERRERRLAHLARAYGREMKAGEGMGRLRGPAAAIDSVVVADTDTESLERGPGHYPTTALPGAGATIAVAGHRTTYGAPFHDIDDFEPGDEVRFELPYGTFVYVVDRTAIVKPTDVHIVRDIGRERLVLTACHPLYSAAERYAVFAGLERVEPAG